LRDGGHRRVPASVRAHRLDADIVFGLAVIIFLMYEPQGLARIWQRVKSYFTLWPYAY
jgi:hypothetical protein